MNLVFILFSLLLVLKEGTHIGSFSFLGRVPVCFGLNRFQFFPAQVLVVFTEKRWTLSSKHFLHGDFRIKSSRAEMWGVQVFGLVCSVKRCWWSLRLDSRIDRERTTAIPCVSCLAFAHSQGRELGWWLWILIPRTDVCRRGDRG